MIYSKFTKEWCDCVLVCKWYMLIFGTNIKSICEKKKYQTLVFNMKNLNETDIILGIKGEWHNEGYALCQSHYIGESAS